jgi:hypothetical protein
MLKTKEKFQTESKKIVFSFFLKSFQNINFLSPKWIRRSMFFHKAEKKKQFSVFKFLKHFFYG